MSVHAEPPPPIVTEPHGINYATGSALGKGGFAICHRAERYDGSRPTGHLVALKIVKTKMEPAKLAQKFVTELQIHSKLSHPNIVAFYRAFSFHTSTYVVLELCPNGSLADMLKKRKHLTLPEIRRFIIQIAGAVKYLHHRHIVHRDLKTGNLFLDHEMNVKVGDFGLAALLVTEREMEVKRRTTMCGTPNYLAPEILEKGKGHDEKVDLWAIGVIAYTLAVGKAPFHASTKEEIYKKLKSGTYTWPELSATTNQSADLRNLVASLLVPEEQRPPPDKIVSQNFFKIAFVPSSIPTSAKEKAPQWPEVSVPSAETIRKGYSDTWFAICKQSGVGEYDEENGRCFRLNGGKKVKSIVHDFAVEAQLGKQPTMPIPKDMVYLSTVSNWDSPTSSLVEETEGETSREEARRNQNAGRAGRQLREIGRNEVAGVTRPTAASRRPAQEERDAELMPPPSRPASRSARTGTVRKAARTISEETAESNQKVNVPYDEPAPAANLRVAKTRQAPAQTVNSASAMLKELNISGDAPRTRDVPQESRNEKPAARTVRANGSVAVKRSADASLARRPRAASSRATAAKKERPLSPEVPDRLATLEEMKQASPPKPTRRRKVAEPEVIEIHSDQEEGQQQKDEKPAPAALNLPPPPTMGRKLPVPRKPSRSHITPPATAGVPGTQPDIVLQRLHILRSNLSAALDNRSPASSAPAREAEQLPFVSRWVDYSRKHGVGYVMSDGTVGCIINASAANPAKNKPATPVTHIFVRNGQRWLSRVGGTKSNDFSGLDHVPLEVLEDRGEEGTVRKVYKGLGSVKEGPLAIEAERRRTLSVLWVKFGRYMCQSLDGEEKADAGGNNSDNFVRFYQRIGSVGIWAFADGCLQVHFPDHTKLVLSATGQSLSATTISTEAAAYLASHGDLLPHHVSSREVYTDSTSALLHEGGRIRQRIIRANQLQEKLDFVLQVVEQWERNEGLGRLDGDEDGYRMAGGEKLEWMGLAVRDGAKKVDRVTVGRYGGDDAVRQAC
ncbi:Pkinase-domain-containing protein [Hortaea werneckii]|nr:Pkinase-domain-containing protein [Hortaea werneckii]KAI7303864.1 Pkinase-domain-containing protein [Hortaea werneckii]